MNDNPRWQDQGEKPARIGRPRIYANGNERKKAWYARHHKQGV